MICKVILRPARADEQWKIRFIVWRARINPFDLKWQRFLVAEEEGNIIGVGQVKPHRDGSRELASLAVILSRRGQAVGRQLIRALLARERGVIFLTCRASLENYYARFGFRRATDHELPPYFQHLARVQRFLPIQVIIMRRVMAQEELLLKSIKLGGQ